MSAAQLMTDLARLGICIEAHGDRLRYSPRSAVTPDLADRMKAHKRELLAILSPDAERSAIQWCETAPRDEVQEALESVLAELDAIAAERDRLPAAPEPTAVIDAPDPCPECGTLELWQSLAGNWRCLRCDPPTKARRLRERAARLITDRTDSPTMNARGDP